MTNEILRPGTMSPRTGVAPTTHTPTHLALRGLHFAYRRGGNELFGGLDHTFAPGAVTVVTGVSGKGKSTLLYVLGLLLRPTAGQVLLDGQEVSSLRDVQRSGLRSTAFGFVFQDAVLDPGRTVLDAVLEPTLYAGRDPAGSARRARSLLDLLDIRERADHRPGEVSGGQAQRVAVARALVNDPAVILADEPTGNLDRDNATVVLDSLGTAASQGRTVVIATHDPFVMARADEVLVL